MFEVQVTIKAPEIVSAIEKLADAIKPKDITMQSVAVEAAPLKPFPGPSAQVGEAMAAGVSAGIAAVNTHMAPPEPPAAPVASIPVTPPAPPAAPAVPTTAPDYTHEQLGRAASAYLDANPSGRAQLVALLQQFGVQGIQQLATPEARTAFAAAMRQLGVQV